MRTTHVNSYYRRIPNREAYVRERFYAYTNPPQPPRIIQNTTLTQDDKKYVLKAFKNIDTTNLTVIITNQTPHAIIGARKKANGLFMLYLTPQHRRKINQTLGKQLEPPLIIVQKKPDWGSWKQILQHEIGHYVDYKIRISTPGKIRKEKTDPERAAWNWERTQSPKPKINFKKLIKYQPSKVPL